MSWSERQRAMLRAMGLAVWSPQAPEAIPGESETEVVSAEVPPATASVSVVPVQPAMRAPIHVAQAVAQAAGIVDPGGVGAMDWPALRAAVAACRACALCESRTQTVFGVGHPEADLMVVGEAPGEQEDLKGEPFVGPAGQLLDAMLRAIGLSRQDGPPERQVYIANTLKCRPPRNRNPEPAELAKCEPFLRRQLVLVQPKVILAMGRFAVQQLLRSDEAIGRLRGRVHTYEGVPLVVTYHPAYLLRQPADKSKAWEDLCLAANLLQPR
jgi:uracil-DNA glycosylase family 4